MLNLIFLWIWSNKNIVISLKICYKNIAKSTFNYPYQSFHLCFAIKSYDESKILSFFACSVIGIFYLYDLNIRNKLNTYWISWYILEKVIVDSLSTDGI